MVLAVVGVAAAVGLVVVLLAADLNTAAAAGSVVGAVVGVAATWVSVAALLRSSSASVTVQADSGSNAAGRDMRNPQARETGVGSAPPPAPRPGVSASGGSNAAGQDMEDPTAYRGL
ncbi:hypothetical protein [Streptomyces huasconensis]|uniref:hypothetical protein n=1 Tax=Streptomyces huasconensis TaxID=1854574 RepID=UPI0033D14D63